MLVFCREQFKTRLLAEQMDQNGSYAGIARTKPYAYSIFALDNLVTLCHILSTPNDNLWDYQLPDGRGIRKGIDFLTPYLINKAAWPYRHDVECLKSGLSAISFTIIRGA